jgi:very-short-patch-repair endonuclease
MRKATDIERAVARILQNEKLSYVREYRIGTYPVDFYLRDFNLTIQADGCYHHGCPYCYTSKDLQPRQKKQTLKDKACVVFHRHSKINIIRFYGCHILEDPQYVISVLKDSIEEICDGGYVNRSDFKGDKYGRQ